jgi:hypothetical protein
LRLQVRERPKLNPFPLERGADAHRYIGERKNVGKVVLTL